MHVSIPSFAPRSRRTHRALILTVGLGATLACVTKEQPPADTGPLTAKVSVLDSVTTLGTNPLGDSARILSVIPESDGEAIALILSDPAQGVSAALMLAERRRGGVHLVWPDSVDVAWWPASHQLAFRTATGHGSRVVVDVHAAALEAIEPEIPDVAIPGAPSTVDSRAGALIDSVLNARATGGADLRFRALSVVSGSSGFVAVYAATTDAGGRQWNPRWVIADSSYRHAVPIDSITGPVTELPAVAGWTGGNRFLYAKGRMILEATVRGATMAR